MRFAFQNAGVDAVSEMLTRIGLEVDGIEDPSAKLAAFTIAEHFRDQGAHVLLILDSLSRVVHGARDVAMARGEAMGARGFPASALGLIATLAERAGGDRRSGGAITAICTVLAEAGEGDSGGNDADNEDDNAPAPAKLLSLADADADADADCAAANDADNADMALPSGIGPTTPPRART